MPLKQVRDEGSCRVNLSPLACPHSFRPAAGRLVKQVLDRNLTKALPFGYQRALGCRDDTLTAFKQPFNQELTPAGVEFAHYIIKEHQRWGGSTLKKSVSFREEKSQQTQSLLAL